MPYAEGRIYNDADSHIMETFDWLISYADPKVRDRIKPMSVQMAGGKATADLVGALPGIIERRRHDADANEGILGSRLRVRYLLERGINAGSRVRNASFYSVGCSSVIDEGKILDVTRIELPVGNSLAVRTPAESVPKKELLFINPI